jgi:hypothetical protein
LDKELPEVRAGERIEVFNFIRPTTNENTAWTAERLADTYQTIADQAGRIVTEYTTYSRGDTFGMQIVAAFPKSEDKI